MGTRAVRRAGPLEPHPPRCAVVSRTSSLAMGSSPGGWDKVGDKGMAAHPQTDGSEPSQGRETVTGTSVSTCGKGLLTARVS